MTIDVASADVGTPPAGANLYSVTSYALTHALPTPPTPPSFSNFTDYPQIGDSMPAYNVEGASTTATTPATPATTPAVTGATNNLPNTATSPAQAVLSLALLAGSAAVAMTGSAVRRRRRARVGPQDSAKR